MKILSGFVNGRRGRRNKVIDSSFFPKKEIEVHLDSYLKFGHDCVFYTNYAYSKQGVDVRDFQTDTPHGYIAKHLMTQRFFKDYPDEEEVLYVDYDTFLNHDFDFNVLRSKDGFSISAYTHKRFEFQSGVFWVSREFVELHYQDFIAYMEKGFSLEKTKWGDEPFLRTYIHHNFSYTMLPVKYNFSPHRWKQQPDIIPNIMHFHIEEDHVVSEAMQFLSEDLTKLVEAYLVVHSEEQKPILEKDTQRKRHRQKKGLLQMCDHINQQTLVNKMVEIGSYTGESISIFHSKFLKCELFAVDPWVNGYDDGDNSSWKFPMNEVEMFFDEAIKDKENIKKCKMSSSDASLNFSEGELDLVYIDGNHTYDAVKEDIKLWLPKIKTGGFITGHDYHGKHFPGVTKAVNEILGEPDKIFKDTSWLVKV